MSDKKERDLKEMEYRLCFMSQKIEENTQQLSTLKEEFEREKRSKELEGKRLEDKGCEVASLEHERVKLLQQVKDLNQEIKELDHQLHFKN